MILSFLLLPIFRVAVQNERDRISCRRPSYEEQTSNGSGLSVVSLLQAEMLSRQVGAALEVSLHEHYYQFLLIHDRSEYNETDNSIARTLPIMIHLITNHFYPE